ncbi:hypothetical protein SAMCCGM7_pC0034 (plasmid) [Sinorhizobium americanum CCGM7]|nr:hypothetical protein SAMCCGM7_pC0034 [Sinorhizobium americanum CCGM7]
MMRAPGHGSKLYEYTASAVGHDVARQKALCTVVRGVAC